MKKQKYKEAVINTRKMILSLGLSGNVRSVDDTVKYLIKHGVHVKYLQTPHTS